MSVPVIIFTVVYCLTLFSYFITETSGKMSLRAPNKTALALMFFIFAVVMFVKDDTYNITSNYGILIVALFLAMMGDIFLLFNFNRGGDFFLAGNVGFATFYISLFIENGYGFSSYWWSILIIALLLVIVSILFVKLPNVFKLGKMKWPMVLYLSSVTTQGMLGLAVALVMPQYMLFGIGAFLFMLSDYVLTVDRFVCVNNKWTLRANSALYFVGLLLIVLQLAH